MLLAKEPSSWSDCAGVCQCQPTRDAVPPRNFASARRAETYFARQLRKVAKHIGEIVNAFNLGDPTALPALERTLARYAEVLEPWAQATTLRMQQDVSRRDLRTWRSLTAEMSTALRQEIANAPTGETLRRLLAEQVHLITSLPIEAGQRVHELTLQAIEQGDRFSEIVGMIRASGAVSESRANLIARTEVARTSASLTMARAQHVGSEGYVWRTAKDSDVRPKHKVLEGKYIRWDDPPVAGERGERAHAGMIYNCRCYPEPVLPGLE
jgi:SPP1 gp7 family putative phage head morphogenesis protein